MSSLLRDIKMLMDENYLWIKMSACTHLSGEGDPPGGAERDRKIRRKIIQTMRGSGWKCSDGGRKNDKLG